MTAREEAAYREEVIDRITPVLWRYFCPCDRLIASHLVDDANRGEEAAILTVQALLEDARTMACQEKDV